MAVADHVEEAPVDPCLHAVDPGALLGQPVREHRQHAGPDAGFRQRFAQRRGDAQQGAEVVAEAEYSTLLVECDQRTVGLDRAGHMDGFVLAVGEGDGLIAHAWPARSGVASITQSRNDVKACTAACCARAMSSAVLTCSASRRWKLPQRSPVCSP